jgi:hypothetical protein
VPCHVDVGVVAAQNAIGAAKVRERYGSAPILVACMSLIVGLLFLPETKDVDITK